MDVTRWGALQDTFDRLADRNPEDQANALRALTAEDPAMAQDIRELLEEDASGQKLPEINVERLLQAALQDEHASWPDGGQIGPYRILRLLGEGGMGVVYLAERTDIAGHVAIKLLRDAWLSPIRRERFAIEQQMLGLLKHSSVARIYDAGTTQDGTPWFVMEFSDGVPITEYLAARQATGRDVAKLVRTVCDTVRYAHGLAIIHRDLKPSNILVTEDGQIKLLDFGIAKQMDSVNRGSAVTTLGVRLFTPAYAAPELQSENKVGVFTDVYSMGVILYQLVTGSLPSPDGDPVVLPLQRPSELSASVAPDNRLGLSRSEWADIDAICMKSLQREPENRYRSMDGLISDLDAFLEDRPLAARRNALFYTTWKFLYRNRLPVLSTLLGLLLVVTGTILFTVRLARARDVAGRARDQAIAEADRSARLQRFTESLFTGGAGYGIPPPEIRVTQMLDRGRSEAMGITSDPRLQADMFQVLGTAYFNLGHYADAKPLLKRAQEEVCAFGRSVECADVEVPLGQVIIKDGPISVGVALVQDALRIKQEKLSTHDLSIVITMNDYANASGANGDYGEAENLYRQALSIASAYGQPTQALADALEGYAIYDMPYNDPRAIEYTEQSVKIREKLFGRNSYETANSEASLGTILLRYGKYPQAEQHYRLALSMVQSWSGADEGITVRYIERLCDLMIHEGKFEETKALLGRALTIISGSSHPSSLEQSDAFFDLGFIELQQGHLNAAEHYFQKIISLYEHHLAVDDAPLEYSELGLAEIYERRGDDSRAESMLQHILATAKLKTGYGVVAAHSLMGHALVHQHRFGEAEIELQQAYEWFSHDSTIRPQTVQTYVDLAAVQAHLGRQRQAERIVAELHTHPR